VDGHLKNQLKLDEENHLYYLNGELFSGPSVTTVISASGLMGYLPDDIYYLNRGKFVHEAIALYLKGRLEESSLSEGIKPFVDSAIEYITVTGYRAEHVELSLFDPVYLYCGTLDALPLRDWKSGGKSYWHSLQISAYYNLAVTNNLKPELPLNVHLNDKGKLPKVEPYRIQEIREAQKVFLSALCVYQARKNHGLLKKEK